MTFPAYPEYKESGIEWLGLTPADWGVMQLRRLFTVVNGATPESTKDHYWGGDIVWVTPDDLGNNHSMWIADSRRKLTEQGYASCGTTLVPAKSVVVSTRAPVGHVGIAARDLCVNQGCRALVPRLGVDSRFYAYWILQFKDILQAFSGGSTFQELSSGSLASFCVVQPTLSEQASIANFLEHETARIDALIEEQQRLIELLKEKREAVISHAVTKGLDPDVPMKDSGVEWLGEVPAHWEVGALKRFWRVVDCKHVTADFIDDGYPLASIREVQSRYVDLGNANRTSDTYFHRLISDGRSPETGDLILSRNATVGEVAEVAAWHPPFAMGQDVCLLKRRCSERSSAYLYYAMKSAPLVEQISNLLVGSTFKRINVEQVCRLMVAMPPPVEQLGIAEFLDHKASQWDSLVREAEEAIDLLWERRLALISAAVTGKIDVRDWEPPESYGEAPPRRGREVPA